MSKTAERLLQCVSNGNSENAVKSFIEPFMTPKQGRPLSRDKAITELEECISVFSNKGYKHIVDVAKEIVSQLKNPIQNEIEPPDFQKNIPPTPPKSNSQVSYQVPPPPAVFLPKDYYQSQVKAQVKKECNHNCNCKPNKCQKINGDYVVNIDGKNRLISEKQVKFFMKQLKANNGSPKQLEYFAKIVKLCGLPI